MTGKSADDLWSADPTDSAGTHSAGLRIEHPTAGVLCLVLDRPEKLNALDSALFHALLSELDRVATDPSVRVVVLRGAAGAFTVGGDLDSIGALGDKSAMQIERALGEITRVSALLRDLPQPTLAAIDGPVVGAGVGLALACDIRIAHPNAIFFTPFIHMGLVPDCGVSWLLPRLLGEGRALQMLLTGRSLDGRAAETIGLVTEIAEDPFAAATELAAVIARRPYDAVRATKRLLRRVEHRELSDAIACEAAAQAAALTGSEFPELHRRWRATHTPD